jgi:hypothetical protein
MNMMMKPWQTPLNKAANKRGKEEERERERGLKSEQEEQSSKWVTKGAKEQICSRAPPEDARSSMSEKESKPKRVVSLQKLSPSKTGHLKIEMAHALCKAPNTFSL